LRPAAGPAGDLARGQHLRAERDARLPGGHEIAKTFAFPNGANEEVVETRLLIHRAKTGGGSYWEGMAFIWDKDGSGNRTDAHLAIAGGTASVAWNYEDPDPDVNATYVGSTNRYLIPHANQCGTCHVNDDKDPGDSPIGPKVRLLNRPVDYGSGPENQLQHWVSAGLLGGAPALTSTGPRRDQRAAAAALHCPATPRHPASEPAARADDVTRSTRRCARARSSRPTARTVTTATASRRAPACSSTRSGA
jgi:hypothetical protein